MKYLYILAWSMLVAAIVLDLCGKSYCSQAVTSVVRSMTSDQADRSRAHDEATAAACSADRCALVGIIFAGLGLVFWVASMIRGKRITLIPLALLVFYLGLGFIVV
jgi:hypothetical protein